MTSGGPRGLTRPARNATVAEVLRMLAVAGAVIGQWHIPCRPEQVHGRSGKPGFFHHL
jgi:hypothetical protein